MVNEMALVESRALRNGVAERTEVLDKVKTVSLLPDGLHVTTRMVANYFEVAETAIRSMVCDHREELESNGYRLATSEEVSAFKALTSVDRFASKAALFTRRTVLNVAMLLRDSVVARQVRTYLLNAEEMQRPQPVDNFVHRLATLIDDRIVELLAQHMPAHTDSNVAQIAEATCRTTLGRAVVPLLNVAVQSGSEHRARLETLEGEVTHLRRVLREREAAGSMGALDAMNPRQFEQHIAWLCRRDGCDRVTVTGGHGDTGADIVAYAEDGRRIVVQCKSRTPAATITSGDVQQFAGMAKLEYNADIALLVATCPFTRDALLLAARHDVTAVHRGLLESWNSGTKLCSLN
ncbi:restriction endonuclease [Streptomyces sp. NBC_01142]|uniref:restriction endonuclease n=1 Tax=Streptomyces sp. NBC_01142 TaxID=2975865 RepID=UPI0022504A8B|nr:restriction endonuclease [Streptomyces sp. NBC_01142]MCX4824330.1 restriction endonuclease [Streptomyces sp. NBC_01142]